VAGRRARGARPPRPRNQHFLRTRALAAELVADACVRPDETVVDIGAGSGRLTAELARAARRVIAVELDPRWARELTGRWPNVDVVHGDAAAVALPRVPFRVVANLPFDRTTDLLHALLDDPRTPLERADLVVEWGVAWRRATPWPSTLNGVRWSAWYRFSVSRRLARTSFDPPPAVEAGVLVAERRPLPLVPEAQAEAWAAFVARGFRHGLRSVVSTRQLGSRAAGRCEPRELDAHEWAALFRDRAGVRPGKALASRPSSRPL